MAFAGEESMAYPIRKRDAHKQMDFLQAVHKSFIRQPDQKEDK